MKADFCILILCGVVGCKADKDGTEGDVVVDVPDTESGLPEGVDPGPFEGCDQVWQLTDASPSGSEVEVGDEIEVRGRFIQGHTWTEFVDCPVEFAAQLVVDGDRDPNVIDWARIGSTSDWTYEGDRVWVLDLLPDRGLLADNLYAVEVSVNAAGELPFGLIWQWETTP